MTEPTTNDAAERLRVHLASTPWDKVIDAALAAEYWRGVEAGRDGVTAERDALAALQHELDERESELKAGYISHRLIEADRDRVRAALAALVAATPFDGDWKDALAAARRLVEPDEVAVHVSHEVVERCPTCGQRHPVRERNP